MEFMSIKVKWKHKVVIHDSAVEDHGHPVNDSPDSLDADNDIGWGNCGEYFNLIR